LENVFFSVPELTKELKARRKAEMIERKLKNAEKLENEKLDDEKLEEMIEENDEKQVFKIVEQERKVFLLDKIRLLSRSNLYVPLKRFRVQTNFYASKHIFVFNLCQ